eukprot:TRINITY_DN2683_c1_g1_i4.p1 TRINITY_DN2683_c1_g1~~TRINITY_DN2683_c1_g1_i4.p1  ORF type:complete len:937 (+),score=36.65 TRINITY_DN2683_c1_g1_i4:162-2813(+)
MPEAAGAPGDAWCRGGSSGRGLRHAEDPRCYDSCEDMDFYRWPDVGELVVAAHSAARAPTAFARAKVRWSAEHSKALGKTACVRKVELGAACISVAKCDDLWWPVDALAPRSMPCDGARCVTISDASLAERLCRDSGVEWKANKAWLLEQPGICSAVDSRARVVRLRYPADSRGDSRHAWWPVSALRPASGIGPQTDGVQQECSSHRAAARPDQGNKGIGARALRALGGAVASLRGRSTDSLQQVTKLKGRPGHPAAAPATAVSDGSQLYTAAECEVECVAADTESHQSSEQHAYSDDEVVSPSTPVLQLPVRASTPPPGALPSSTQRGPSRAARRTASARQQRSIDALSAHSSGELGGPSPTSLGACASDTNVSVSSGFRHDPYRAMEVPLSSSFPSPNHSVTSAVQSGSEPTPNCTPQLSACDPTMVYAAPTALLPSPLPLPTDATGGMQQFPPPSAPVHVCEDESDVASCRSGRSGPLSATAVSMSRMYASAGACRMYSAGSCGSLHASEGVPPTLLSESDRRSEASDRCEGGVLAQQPLQRACFEFVDQEGKHIHFVQQKGPTCGIAMSVNGNDFDPVSALEYDEASAQLLACKHCVLLPSEGRVAIEARLRALAEYAGIPHNIMQEAPAVFEVSLKYRGEALGLAFAVIASGSVIVREVLGNGACARAGVLPGVIRCVDGIAVRNGMDISQAVEGVRASDRRTFTIEVAPMASLGQHRAPAPLCVYVTVNYRYNRADTVVAADYYASGCPVLVESQDGVDLGFVGGCVRAAASGPGAPRVAGRIKRKATAQELSRLRHCVAEDEAGLRFVQQQARLLDVPVAVHHVAFQYDRRRAFIHFSSPPQTSESEVARALEALGASAAPIGAVQFVECAQQTQR